MFLANILILITAALLLFLGLIIIVADFSKILNKTLAMFQFGAFIWLITNLATNISHSNETALFFARLALIGAVVMLVSILFFALEMSGTKLTKFRAICLLVVPAILLVSVPTGYNINSIETAGENLKTGPIYILLIAFVIAYSVLTVYLFWRTYYRADKNSAKKTQLRYIIVGAIFTFVPAVVLSAIMPVLGFPGAAFYGPISIIALSISTTIVIVRHRFLNIRLLAARSIAYLLAIIVIVAVYALGASMLAGSIPALAITYGQAIFFAIFSVITALLYQPIKHFFDKLTSKIFYQDAYVSQDVINQINSTLVNVIRLEELLGATAKTIQEEIKLTYVNFYLAQKASIESHLAGSNTKIFASEQWDKAYDVLEKGESKISLVSHENLSTDLSNAMRALNIECIVNMTANQQNVGFLVVGGRKSGNALTSKDVQLLEIIADEVAIAVQNALRFEEISQFNITLQQKINDATHLLQKSNEKLKKLDEAKDEFISMASHQLRTPLTSVKGYISMVMDGDAGPVNDQQKNFLDQAFLSSQRMVYLIADLLNVSRLKTGKFIIEAKPTYLPDVVESEISQLTETAKARDLKMQFDKPSEFPTLNLDETKVRQVIMNFADNAIYYTPKGGKITINLKQTDKSVEFTVHDTGIGVPKSEQHHLFTKFYRAGNAKKARPDGTGLGLFMAKKVVVAQGGAIIFKTEEGKGSTFGFSFPLEKLQTPVDK